MRLGRQTPGNALLVARSALPWNPPLIVRRPEHVNPLGVEPETDFNAKWPFRSFKVICFSVSEEPLRGYIVQNNNYCELGSEGSEDIASERSENRHFDSPTLI